ncbi:MAG: DUF488 family protein [Deltaproteobacteria bacterium]|nr:DUF488 family protein [Deltaproteobacteria bacterium]
MNTADTKSIELFTIGHSNRTFTDFLALLKEFEIQALVDIRRFPSSKKFPHFNRGSLEEELALTDIRYYWLEPLGGRRNTANKEASPNQALETTAFRNYADHMLTPEFRKSIDELLGTARSQRTTVMCAEKLFWKCHRRLLCDHLLAQNITAQHIIDPGRLQRHKLTAEARIEGDHVVYPLPLLAGSKLSQPSTSETGKDFSRKAAKDAKN